MLEPDRPHHFPGGLGRDLLNLLCVSYCDKHRGWRLAPERKGNMPQPQSSPCGSGLPLPSTCGLLKQPPQGTAGKCLHPTWLRAFWLGLFLHHVLISQWLSQALQWSICFQKRGGTGLGLVHCSHGCFCSSISPGLCHHCTSCTDVPKPPSHSQIAFDSIMFLPLFFLTRFSSSSFDFQGLFPNRPLAKKQLQSLNFLSLGLSNLSLNTVKFRSVENCIPLKSQSSNKRRFACL